MTLILRPSLRARLSYMWWVFGGAVIFASGFAWAAGLKRGDPTFWILLVAAFALLWAPPLLLMRIVVKDDGILIRNYFRATYIPWGDMQAITITRPPIPSPMRRFGWVLEIQTRDGKRVSTGALLNASDEVVGQVTGVIRQASMSYGFSAPANLERLRLAR